MRSLIASFLLVVAGLAGPAAAQDPALSLPPPVLTIDQDRLFAETRPGTEISDELEARVNALAEENQMIEAELTAAERDLTERRPSLPPEEFRDLADAFDARVQRIRAEQDQKAREITQASEAARQEFFNDVAGIISDIVREKGALIVIDRRDVFLSADRIDITEEAIQRINAARDQ
ncbi:OmpH family outer membrane protein [Alphaproteobacteria bacterium GH1-50]|uniref:OmpH family outer membrane protein n=1 Tax=Kangsaoukella pontilimi TaxID=2691042 RepID=A0A7C9MC02_9RHOB|nr:OmpH family outer membrane protein [Kangsaoukella pontilimi]MXQ07211.1 OmpH family outer membrane protein [Kangsaoukella pontilimi]